MTNASLGTVSVRIDGQDVGLADVMGRINQQMQQNAKVTLAAGEALDKQSSYAERARNASLTYVNALVRQRVAAGESLDNFTTPEVARVIAQNNLYKAQQ